MISKYEWGRKYFPKIYPHVKNTWRIELDTERNTLTIETDDGSHKFSLSFDEFIFQKYDYGKEPKFINYLGFNDLSKSWFPFTKELHFHNIEWYREILTYYKMNHGSPIRLTPASDSEQYDRYCERLIYRKTGNLTKLGELKREYRKQFG